MNLLKQCCQLFIPGQPFQQGTQPGHHHLRADPFQAMHAANQQYGGGLRLSSANIHPIDRQLQIAKRHAIDDTARDRHRCFRQRPLQRHHLRQECPQLPPLPLTAPRLLMGNDRMRGQIT